MGVAMRYQLAMRWSSAWTLALTFVLGSGISDGAGGSYVYFLAEGATGAFFDFEVLVANPNVVDAPISMTFLKSGGTSVTHNATVPAGSRRTFRIDSVPGLDNTAVSVVITSLSNVPLGVERTMFADPNYYVGHGGAAVDGAATRWYFAEGAQGFFDTYVLLANANSSQATATVEFLLEGGSPLTRTYSVGPTSRFNVVTSQIPELAGKSFSIVVDSDLPIIAERAMYFGTTRFWDGAHESPGVTGLSRNWFFAEGATGSFFDTYVLIGNPNEHVASIDVTYLLASGLTINKRHSVPGRSRLTLNLESEHPLLADTAVSTAISSDLPVVSERAMYWPGEAGAWYEAHNSFGVTSTAPAWVLAEGRIGTPQGFETYILVANPTSSVAQVRATFLRQTGSPVVKRYDIPPTSRFNIYANQISELSGEQFGALIESLNGVGIVVERALYWSAFGQFWAGGTSATGIPLPNGAPVVGVDSSSPPPAAPLVLGVSPSSVSIAGGTQIAVTGAGFEVGGRVEVDGIDVKSVTVTGATSISVAVPAHAPGTATLVVINPDGQRSQLRELTYIIPAPSLSSIAPSTGPTSGGTAVTLVGTGFQQGAGVTFDGAAAASVSVTDSRTVVATTPPRASGGGVTVALSNPDGQSASLTNAFTYLAPPLPVIPGVVRFATTSITCRCTYGSTITLSIDGNTVGTMSCAQGSRTFDVRAGSHTVNGCDSTECWGAARPTISAGGEYVYEMTCR